VAPLSVALFRPRLCQSESLSVKNGGTATKARGKESQLALPVEVWPVMLCKDAKNIAE